MGLRDEVLKHPNRVAVGLLGVSLVAVGCSIDFSPPPTVVPEAPTPIPTPTVERPSPTSIPFTPVPKAVDLRAKVNPAVIAGLNSKKMVDWRNLKESEGYRVRLLMTEPTRPFVGKVSPEDGMVSRSIPDRRGSITGYKWRGGDELDFVFMVDSTREGRGQELWGAYFLSYLNASGENSQESFFVAISIGQELFIESAGNFEAKEIPWG